MVTTNQILESIRNKKANYNRYNFTKDEGDALKTFFDLSQEFDNIDDMYSLCVSIPKVFFNKNAKLYITDLKTKELLLKAKTEECCDELNSVIDSDITPWPTPYNVGEKLILTIRGKKVLKGDLPFMTKDNIIGVLVISPADDLNEDDVFFFQKYANRIGFNIHNRFLLEKHIEHLRFIKSLVADIEHNIIVPNMVFKLFLRRLNGKISKNKDIANILNRYINEPCDDICVKHLLEELTDVNRGLSEEFGNIDKHYNNTSLFLETLLRKSHFDKGHLTLRTKSCNMLHDVVEPQIERLAERFRDMEIEIKDHLSGVAGDEIIAVVDVGLIAQVYANFFSNALKYTEEVELNSGKTGKYVSFGREVLKDYFGLDKSGVKYYVFSSGRQIGEEEREMIFSEGYRGTNVSQQPGTGHGLTFIKNAVEIHGGVVGCEPAPKGNNFYFILPA